MGYEERENLDALLSLLGGGQVVKELPELKAALIELPAGMEAGQALGKLKRERLSGLRYVQPNYTHPYPTPVENAATLSLNDPLLAQKWDHDIMQAADAWATEIGGNYPTGAGVVVGVVDTGIDGTHPDLAGGFAFGWDAVGCSTSGAIPPGMDASMGQTHGTHVAGIAAARGDNGQGVAGVAPEATLMDLQVFCGGSTTDFVIAEAVIAAIYDLDGDGVVPDVITMSLGGKGYSQVVKDALDSAMTGYNVVTGDVISGYDDGTSGGVAGDGVPDRTVTVTVAMANSSQDEVFYPAGYPGVIAVGATNARDEKAGFSTSGSHISVAAPGVDILSTWPTWYMDPTGRPYLYFRISGTSMATPQVAGAVALVKQFLPGATGYEVRRLLETTADDIGPAGFDPETGWGRINLKALVDEVANVVGGASTEQGAVAAVRVLTKNAYDSNFDGVIDTSDERMPIPAVDVQLLQGGEVRYLAKTNDDGLAYFVNIAPGTYDVMVAGQDITDGLSMAIWPHERTSWDADGDASNGVTLGQLSVTAGDDFASASASPLEAELNTTFEVTLEWTGGGDLDLAVLEYDPASFGAAWSTAKTGALWGSFSGDDDGSNSASASETYTLADTHYTSLASWWYQISIDATNAAVGTTATLTLTMNGITKSSGPIPVTPGTTANDNDFPISLNLFFSGAGFDNWLTVY